MQNRTKLYLSNDNFSIGPIRPCIAGTFHAPHHDWECSFNKGDLEVASEGKHAFVTDPDSNIVKSNFQFNVRFCKRLQCS